MKLIDNDRNDLNLPNSIILDAKSGASIDWFMTEGIHKLYKLVNNTNNNYKYHVIFNMGINDLAEDLDVEKRASEYYNLYKKIIDSNQNIDFYFLSVNPIDEKILYSSDLPYYNSRTNKKVEKFNNFFIKKLRDEKLSNVKYCDSYNSLNFVLPDGLHYDFNTNKEIISYIISECVEI